MSFNRKLRKLIRNPGGLFRDSMFNRRLHTNQVKHQELMASATPSTSAGHNSEEHISTMEQALANEDMSPEQQLLIHRDLCAHYKRLSATDRVLQHARAAYHLSDHYKDGLDLVEALRNNGAINDETISVFHQTVRSCPANERTSISYQFFSFLWEARPINQEVLDHLSSALGSVPKTERSKPTYDRLRALHAAMLHEAGRASAAIRIVRAIKDKKPVTPYMPLRYTAYLRGERRYLSAFELNNFRKYLSHRGTFSRLVQDHKDSLCVVGNAPVADPDADLGARIDQHRLVIRFNNYNTCYPHNTIVGTKTDIWVRLPFHPYVRRELDPKIKLMMLTGSNRHHRGFSEWETVLEFISNGTPVEFFDPDVFYDLQRRLGCPPTAGLLVCYSIYKIAGPLRPGQIIGFSHTAPQQNAQYHMSDPFASPGSRHNWEGEAAIFEQITQREPASNSIFRSQVIKNDEPTPSSLEYFDATHYDRIISVSPGLEKYTIDGMTPEYVTPRHVDRIIGKPVEDVYKELIQHDPIKPRDKICVLGFGRAVSGRRAEKVSSKLQCDCVHVEFGLITSFGLPRDGGYNFSLILDRRGIFYDTTTPSDIENILLRPLPNSVIARSKSLIDKIVECEITKYNNSQSVILPRPASGCKRILVIDQTANDNSIVYGQCSHFTFNDMICRALEEADEVVFKVHPETVSGAKGGNFDLEDLRENPRILLLDRQCNIISVIKQVDEVFVMTSGVGMEALLCGKRVTCFGVPFYAGWGLTRDLAPVLNQRRELSLEELFAATYILYTKYFHPTLGHQISVEECLDAIISHKSAATH